MGWKNKLASTGMARFIAQNTPLMQGMGKKLVPATSPEEAIEIAHKLIEMDYHICLHHLGRTTDDVETIQENVAIVNETMEIMDEEGLEVCFSLVPSEIGYLRSAKGGENFGKKIGRNFANRIDVRNVEERQGFGEGTDQSKRNLMILHASERVPMQRVLALYGHLKRADVKASVTLPAGLARSYDDAKAIISQGGNVRLSMVPQNVSGARSEGDLEETQDNYMKIAKLLLSEDAMIQQVMPTFALDDLQMAEQIIMLSEFNGWSNLAFEFEIPYGVNNALKRKLKDDGYTVRVLVPFGKEWWPYFVRINEMAA